MKKYQVVIFGGGTSGCSAAYNCAKLGLKTLLVEHKNYLGGLMTGGLVVPVMKSSTKNLNCDYYKKLISVSKKYNANIKYSDGNDGWLNPEILKIVLEDILTSKTISKNLDILFETVPIKVNLNKNKIKSVILNHDTLSVSIEASYFIDATGCAGFSKLCGCKMLSDNIETQQNSLRFTVANVDSDKLIKFLLKADKNRDITNTYRNDVDTNGETHFTSASTWDCNKHWALDKYLKNAVQDKVLKEHDRSYFQIFSVAGAKGEVAFNCPRFDNIKDDIYAYSNELVKAKKTIWRLYSFAKAYLPGFEDSYISKIADITGIRECARVKTKYVYKKKDMIESKKFKNPVLQANYPIDIHSSKKNKSVLQKNANYELPIDSLISDDIANLFPIGKNVGAEFTAHSALRVQKSCMSMGEGVAKYIFSLL